MTASIHQVDGIGVVVPAANEEELLPGCLDALAAARAELTAAAPEIDVRIVVVLDACTDRSAAVVAARDGVEAVRVTHRSVGVARASGACHVLAGAVAPERLWIASTDADSLVPRRWLRDMLVLARSGAGLVLGTIEPQARADDPSFGEWRRRYSSADGHRHVHGANLGLRGDLYAALNGWAPLPFDEDVDLVRRTEELGAWQIVRTGAMTVRTSARRDGRADQGFAAYLRGLDSAG